MSGRRLGIYICIAALILVAIFLPGFSRLRRVREQEKKVQEENERLRRINAELEEKIRRLKEDPVYIEGAARDKMGIVKEGEIVYKVVPERKEKDVKKNDE